MELGVGLKGECVAREVALGCRWDAETENKRKDLTGVIVVAPAFPLNNVLETKSRPAALR